MRREAVIPSFITLHGPVDYSLSVQKSVLKIFLKHIRSSLENSD